MLRTLSLMVLSLLVATGAMLFLSRLGEASRVVTCWTALL